MADKFNVLVICGSLRKGSFNAALARALPALAPPEMTFTPAPSFETFPLYNADVQTPPASRPTSTAWPTRSAPPTACCSSRRNTTGRCRAC